MICEPLINRAVVLTEFACTVTTTTFTASFLLGSHPSIIRGDFGGGGGGGRANNNYSSSSSWSVGRRGHRRLPATPTQPSTLNIDSLANISHSISGTGNNSGLGKVNDRSEATLSAPINFPKLSTSPSR